MDYRKLNFSHCTLGTWKFNIASRKSYSGEQTFVKSVQFIQVHTKIYSSEEWLFDS